MRVSLCDLSCGRMRAFVTIATTHTSGLTAESNAAEQTEGEQTAARGGDQFECAARVQSLGSLIHLRCCLVACCLLLLCCWCCVVRATADFAW